MADKNNKQMRCQKHDYRAIWTPWEAKYYAAASGYISHLDLMVNLNHAWSHGNKKFYLGQISIFLGGIY